MKRIYELLQALMTDPFVKKNYSLVRIKEAQRNMPSRQITRL